MHRSAVIAARVPGDISLVEQRHDGGDRSAVRRLGSVAHERVRVDCEANSVRIAVRRSARELVSN